MKTPAARKEKTEIAALQDASALGPGKLGQGLETRQGDDSPLPHLDARLAAAAAFVRQGHVAADIGCDHGKLTAYLAGSGRCPLVIAADLRPEPLARARQNCAPWAERISFRLGDGLSVLEPSEASELILAGMGAQTICELLGQADWIARPHSDSNLILVPATKHSVLRRWLARNGFSLCTETLCVAAGRIYTVINARPGAQPWEPDGLWCLLGKTIGQAAQPRYRAQQTAKLEKYLRGLPPGGKEATGVKKLIAQLARGEQPQRQPEE